MSDEDKDEQLPWAVVGLLVCKTVNSEIIYCNDLFLKYAGAKFMDQVLGKTDINFPWGKYADYYRKYELDALNGKIYSAIHPAKDALGREILIFNTKAPRYNKEKKIVGLVGHVIEIVNPGMLQLNHLLKQTDIVQTEQKYIVGENPEGIKLTCREEEILFYLLRGKSAKIMAKILGISPRTVEVHIDHLRFKFNCKTKNELFTQAVEKGYFNVIPESLFTVKLVEELG